MKITATGVLDACPGMPRGSHRRPPRGALQQTIQGSTTVPNVHRTINKIMITF